MTSQRPISKYYMLGLGFQHGNLGATHSVHCNDLSISLNWALDSPIAKGVAPSQSENQGTLKPGTKGCPGQWVYFPVSGQGHVSSRPALPLSGLLGVFLQALSPVNWFVFWRQKREDPACSQVLQVHCLLGVRAGFSPVSGQSTGGAQRQHNGNWEKSGLLPWKSLEFCHWDRWQGPALSLCQI